MSTQLQIFMEYKIKEASVQDYEKAMEGVIAELKQYEATNIQWFVATEQDLLYVEMFEVPTESHFHALKQLRKSTKNAVFRQIIPFIEGGPEKIHCWAFRKKK